MSVSASGGWGPLRHRNFRLLWSGLIVSNAGSWMQTVAQNWLVLELSRDPKLGAVYLGLIGVARAIPMVLLSLLGGAAADRFDRRRVLFVTQGVMTLQSLTLAILSYTGVIQVWHVILLAAVNAAAFAFDQPARHSLMPDIVPKEDLLAALSLNAIAFNGSAVIGPSLAGPVVALVGIPGAFALNAVSYGAVFLALARMQVPRKQVTRRGSVLADLGAGFRYVRDHPVLLGLLAMATVNSFLARPYMQFLSVFAREVLHQEVGGYGLLQAAPGLGTILFSLWMTRRGDRGEKGRVLVRSGIAFSCALAAFALSPWFPLSWALLVVVGGLNTTFMTHANTLIQQNTDPSVRGRVTSLYTLSALATMPLGQVPMSALISLLDPQRGVFILATLAGLGVWWLSRRVPEVARLP
ncbi:MAG: MFS transporter [Firmicutes bacterium]|nr:MFS transporter [Bacillota bacterium]